MARILLELMTEQDTKKQVRTTNNLNNKSLRTLNYFKRSTRQHNV